MRRSVLPAIVLLALVAACGGRSFKEPRTLAEWRPTRPVTNAGAAPEDDSFRATPPERTAARSRPVVLPTEVRLSNGVRIVMLERHDFPSVSAVLVLDRGATAGAPGVAALYSEAMTGSSREYAKVEAWQYLDYVGGTVQNHTWRDGVALQVTALSPLFVSALTRAAPMFTSPLLDGDDIDEARTQLAAESANEDEDPSAVAYDALYAELFPPSHPYATPVSGERAGLRGRSSARADKKADKKKVPDAAVKAFYASSLSADHVGVAVVGDFKPESMQRVLEKALGKIPKRSAAAAAAVPPVLTKHARRVVVIDRPGAAQSNVAIGWPGPGASEPDLVALDVLAGATAGDLSTRLNITVRKELGASYGVHMSAVGLRDGGVVRISAAIDTARTVDALRGILKELDRLRTEPLAPAELAAAKLRSYEDLERGSTRGLAMYLGRAMAEGLPPAHVVLHNARLDVVTADAVRAAAERYLAPDGVRIVVVGDAARLTEGLRTLGLGDVVRD
jgi:predicted Zn-dependent peptidase